MEAVPSRRPHTGKWSYASRENFFSTNRQESRGTGLVYSSGPRGQRESLRSYISGISRKSSARTANSNHRRHHPATRNAFRPRLLRDGERDPDRPIGGRHPGRKGTLLDEQKGYKFTTTSDNEGRYLFVSIPPGLYSVTAEMQGFEKTVRTHIRVNVTENPTANLTLKVASATQRVEVTGAERRPSTPKMRSTGQVVDRRFINDLPLIDRLRAWICLSRAGRHRQ